MKILLLAVLAAVLYGIVHDQITARVCVEYFTIAHPPVFSTDSPTLLGLGWGVIATWWVGAILGVPAACFARWGKAPKLTVGELIRPLAVLLVVMGLIAAVSGVVCYVLACRDTLALHGRLASMIPADKHTVFLADRASHIASYASGLFGGLCLWAWIWRQRLLRNMQEKRP